MECVYNYIYIYILIPFIYAYVIVHIPYMGPKYVDFLGSY